MKSTHHVPVHTKYNTGSYQARTWNVRLDGCQCWSHGHTLITWHVRKNSHAAGILKRTVIRWARSALGHGRISTMPGCPDGRQGYPSHLPTYRSTGAKQITASMRHWSTSIPPFLHWVWRKSERERQEALLEHHVCVTVSALCRLWHTDVETRFCQCITVKPVTPVWIVSLVVTDQEEKRRHAVSVCYRVGLRGLAKRLCLAWIPRAVEIQLQSHPPPQSIQPSTGLPSLSKKYGAWTSYTDGPLAPDYWTLWPPTSSTMPKSGE